MSENYNIFFLPYLMKQIAPHEKNTLSEISPDHAELKFPMLALR